jgi:hypothetical protein
MYKLKKSFRFRSVLQAQSFIHVAAAHGKTGILGSVVTVEGTHDFTGWRKLCVLARLIRASVSLKPDIEALTAQAGLTARGVLPSEDSRLLLTHQEEGSCKSSPR